MENNHSLPGSAQNCDPQVSDPITASRLQLELELLKNDYKKLLVELYEKRELAGLQSHAIQELQTSISGLLQSLGTTTERRDRLATLQQQLSGELQDREKIISEQARKIQRLHEQTDFLNIQLSEIYASEGWKFLSILYKLRNTILPVGSPMQQRVKKVVNWLRGKKTDNIVIKDHSRRGDIFSDEVVSFDPFSFPSFSSPRVSIVIPAYNGWKMNYLCLRSIWENTEDISYEVIFADDVSTDETQFVGNYIKNIRHIRNTENLGFLKNANHAAALANGEFIHFLNNDTKVTPGWLSSLVTLMDTDKTIGLAGSKLVYPDGRLQEAGGIIWQDASGWNYGHKQDPDAPEYNYVKEVDYISGASILVRKSLWDELGGFDTRYCPAYAEDSDLAFAIREKGYKVVYQPLSKVIHYEGFSHGTEVSPDKGSNIKSYQKINSGKFLEKWHTVLEQQFPNGVNPFWTRDRSRHKPTIVVIDHYVPHFDKDAGSRTTYQLLKLMVRLNYNVKFLGDNFYKHEPYTTHLQQIGIEVLYGEHYRSNWQNWIVENEKYIDYFYINRPHISIKYIDLLREKTKAKIVYYGHDLHFVRERLQYEIEKDPRLLESAENWKQTESRLIRQSDTILTLSYSEKEIIEKEIGHTDVRIMPAFSYSHFNEPITDFDNRRDILFIGGFGHKPNVDAVVWFAKEVFPLIGKELKDLRFIIAGSKAPPDVTQLASSSIDVKGPVSDEELQNLYRSIRLVVIPLRYGAGVKGKTVEAMHYGVPFVTTHFGIEGLEKITSIAEGRDTAESFAAGVLELYTDNARLEDMSRREIEYAKEYFSEERTSDIILKTFS